MQTTKLYVQLYENNIETGLEKKNSLSQILPPSPEIPGPLTPPPLRNFQSLPWEGMDIFWNYTISFLTCNNIGLKALSQSLENHSKATKLMLVVKIKPKQSFKNTLRLNCCSFYCMRGFNADVYNLADKLFFNFY